MNTTSQRTIDHESGTVLQVLKHDNEIGYRIPFSYEKAGNEKCLDAWNSILPLFNRIFSGSGDFQEYLQNLNITSADISSPVTILSQRGLAIQAGYSSSDLWIRISLAETET